MSNCVQSPTNTSDMFVVLVPCLKLAGICALTYFWVPPAGWP